MTTRDYNALFDACHKLAGQVAGLREACNAARQLINEAKLAGVHESQVASVLRQIRDALHDSTKFVEIPSLPVSGPGSRLTRNPSIESRPCGW